MLWARCRFLRHSWPEHGGAGACADACRVPVAGGVRGGGFGRRAGSVKTFPYSDAMRRSNIVWDARILDRFLANPMKAVPGTAMGYAGITDSKARADLIAYLAQANQSAACRR